jgi:predicted N-acetyltransferase YhbS
MSIALAPNPVLIDPAVSAFRLASERGQDRVRVDALVDAAFGPGRFAKTSERVREGNAHRLDLSLCAWALEGDELLGAVRQTPVLIGPTPALFFGPIATRQDQRGHGVGRALTEAACDLGAAAGETVVVLVGALSFFAPLGFEQAPAGQVILPGPVDPARLLWRPLKPGAFEDVGGAVRPRFRP